MWPYLVVGDAHLYARYVDLTDPETSTTKRWYVIEKDDGAIRGSFEFRTEIAHIRPFGVAGGALFEHNGDSVHVWE